MEECIMKFEDQKLINEGLLKVLKEKNDELKDLRETFSGQKQFYALLQKQREEIIEIFVEISKLSEEERGNASVLFEKIKKLHQAVTFFILNDYVGNASKAK